VYGYVGGDPVDWIDPSGLSGVLPLFARPPIIPEPLLETLRPFENATRPVERFQEHHSDPKFMGGDPKQPTTRIPESQHQDLHRDLNDFLRNQTDDAGNHMRPQSNNSGRDIQRNFSRDERLDAMKRFYEEFGEKYPGPADGFFKQHRYLQCK
jgi:hypothetical protein